MDNQPVLLLRTVDHYVNTGCPKMWWHECQGDMCDHCSGNVVLSKTKKLGVHFDDVLVHDVCWSSRRNWGYPSAKDTGIGVVHVNIGANECIDPLIWRPWESLFPLQDLGQWCFWWWWEWESVGSGRVPLVWFKVGWEACSRSKVWQVLPWKLMTWRVWWL